MAQFISFSPHVEVYGAAVISVINGMKAFKSKAFKVLQENGIVDPQSDNWYPMQDWLNCLKRISEEVGHKTLYSIGMAVPDTAKFPPNIDSIETAMHTLDKAYRMNHRKGEIGYYRFEKTDARAGKMSCRNPYPCDLDLGIITAVAKKYKPKDTLFLKVEHNNTGTCRKKEGNTCVYHLQW